MGAEKEVTDFALLYVCENSDVKNRDSKVISWCVDSGCSDHLVNNKDYFTDYIKLKVPQNTAVAKWCHDTSCRHR